MNQKKTILLVDDEKDLSEELGIRLKASGYSVLVAYNGPKGIERAMQEKPDLILLDVIMPKMNGYQVCHDLKNDPKTKSIPVILLTAKTQESDKTWGKECGADEYITKPYEIYSLLSKIKALLEGKKK
ncbi:MAG: response regulator [Deltaproteobacteria bacterium]|nr:response regulator [Deltaproteobacteria bacterium]